MSIFLLGFIISILGVGHFYLSFIHKVKGVAIQGRIKGIEETRIHGRGTVHIRYYPIIEYSENGDDFLIKMTGANTRSFDTYQIGETIFLSSLSRGPQFISIMKNYDLEIKKSLLAYIFGNLIIAFGLYYSGHFSFLPIAFLTLAAALSEIIFIVILFGVYDRNLMTSKVEELENLDKRTIYWTKIETEKTSLSNRRVGLFLWAIAIYMIGTNIISLLDVYTLGDSNSFSHFFLNFDLKKREYQAFILYLVVLGVFLKFLMKHLKRRS